MALAGPNLRHSSIDRATCTTSTAAIKSLAEGFAAQGLCGKEHADTLQVGLSLKLCLCAQCV